MNIYVKGENIVFILFYDLILLLSISFSFLLFYFV